MTSTNPEKHDYLAVVSEWSSMTPRGGLVGNAYPLLELASGTAVAAPAEEFPNPGAVFLTSRGSLNTWDFILLRPRRNDRYKDASERDCFFIAARPPETLEHPGQVDHVASVLESPSFDPGSPSRQLLDPAHNVTPLFFIHRQQSYFGPLQRVAWQRSAMEEVARIDWQPAREDGIVYEFTREDLIERKLRLVEYGHPQPWLNRVIASPLRFVIGNARAVTSSRGHDALSDASAIEWYLKRCAAAELPEQALASLRAAFQAGSNDDLTVLRARMKKVEQRLNTHTAFGEERDRIARRFLESDAGKQRLHEMFEQAVERKALEIQDEVDRREKDLASRRDELDRLLDQAEREHRLRVEQLSQDEEKLRGQVAGLNQTVEHLRAAVTDDLGSLANRMEEQLPLFAALASRRDGVVTVAASTPTAAPPIVRRDVFRPIPPRRDVKPVEDEGKLADALHAQLAGQGLHFARDFVANVYVCLKSSPLNLIIGPPGYGKSMLVTGLARALGHGDALLRIAVRRSWSEDRYLLGFYDSFHGRYDPGAVGLVPRMIQAERDWQQDRTGVYVVLLDEFNLAAPEYYFSQLLQALPGDEPGREIELYDATRSDAEGGGFPARVALTPNLRFWGTINYDETTERLSPRTLDRTGMIFLGEADVTPAVATEVRPIPAVAARDLFGRFMKKDDECPEDRWELVAPVIDLLRSPEASLGPRIELSPRVLRAIKRYLANSRGVLAARLAADFAVQQKILPVIRGRGDDFLARMRALAGKLSEASLARSALHVEEALRRAEQQFGDVDFLSY